MIAGRKTLQTGGTAPRRVPVHWGCSQQHPARLCQEMEVLLPLPTRWKAFLGYFYSIVASLDGLLDALHQPGMCCRVAAMTAWHWAGT